MAVFAEIVKNADTPYVILENSSSVQQFSIKLCADKHAFICDFLSDNCSLSRLKIKDALQKGAVVLSRKNQKQKRIRKAKHKIHPGDQIQFCYNSEILKIAPPNPTILFENSHYSIWYKPPGLLTQGTQFGDHCSLQRLVVIHFRHSHDIKIVHRLDREASGLVLLAHGRQAAAQFSQLFSTHLMEKKYIGISEGKMGEVGDKLVLNDPIDGKKAKTTLWISDVSASHTKLEIDLHTGRKHQIRKHLSAMGFPLIGDQIYGSKGKMNEPLRLVAFQLSFTCPFSNEKRIIRLNDSFLHQFKKYPA